MHKDIIDSGLVNLFEIKPMTSNIELSKFLGKKVRYKKELLTKDFIKAHGTITLKSYFIIKEVQKNYKDEDCLRGYSKGDTFGRAIDPKHIEIIES